MLIVCDMMDNPTQKPSGHTIYIFINIRLAFCDILHHAKRITGETSYRFLYYFVYWSKLRLKL